MTKTKRTKTPADAMLHAVKHTRCGHIFDLGHVTVIGRYADCSTFNCPGCGVHIDDRPGLHLERQQPRVAGETCRCGRWTKGHPTATPYKQHTCPCGQRWMAC